MPIKKIPDYYDTYWETGHHGGAMQGYFQNMLRWMDRELPTDLNFESILEAGCGAASFTKHLAKRCKYISACDLSAGQIEANRAAYPDTNFFVQDLSKPIGEKDKTFDALWCSEVLEHLFDPAYAVKEFHRVLKPDGRLLITVPYHGRVKNVLIALFKWDEHFAADNPHIRFFTIKMLMRLVEKAGFHSIRTETCGMNKPLRDIFIPTNILLSARKISSVVS